jgi:hypothetical protein
MHTLITAALNAADKSTNRKRELCKVGSKSSTNIDVYCARNTRPARIDPHHPEVLSELGERALAIGYGAAETLAAVRAANR